MQNRTEIVGVTFGERLRQALRNRQRGLTHIGMALAGAVLSNSFILGGVSPFGVAFCAAVQGKYAYTAGIGAILGYVLTANPFAHMKYLAAILLVVAGKWLFDARIPQRFLAASGSVICFFALAVADGLVLISGNPTLYDLLISGAELLLACGSAYFFTRTLAALQNGGQALNRSDISCVVIALAVMLMGLSSIVIRGMSVGRILAVLAILLCARYGREAGGAVCGVAAGMALALVSGNYAYIVVAYALGGLVSGIFGGMGRISVAASFIFINTITALFTMQYADVYNAVFETFAATLLFIAIPQGWVTRWGLLGILKTAREPDTTAQIALCERLEDVSSVLKEISVTTREVSERLGAMDAEDTKEVYSRVAEQVCAHCGLRTTCWQFRYSSTVATMNDAMLILKREGSITREQMPAHFRNVCCKEESFVAALNTWFHDQVAKEGTRRKVSKVRGVVTDQFEGMALMLDEMAGNLGGMRLLDASRTKAVKEYMEKQGIKAQQVICYTDQYGRMTVDMHIPSYHLARLHKTKSALDLCALLDADLDPPQITERENYAAVLYCEKASFIMETGAYQIPAGGSRLCGDAYDIIRDRGGQSHLVLSDGMGSGGSAAVDSAMASGLISRLISVGIGHEAALKMVNSALLIKSGEESLATIDICTLDLFTGKAYFYKAGAAPTFLIKSGKAGYVESTSLPAGILRGVAFEKSVVSLREGDWVVMVSDGVIATGVEWLFSELETLRVSGAQQFCERLAATAKLRRVDGKEDDITVLAAMLKRGA